MSVRVQYRLPQRQKRRGRRRGVGRRGKAGRGCYPVLTRLGILNGATPTLASEVSWHAAEAASIDVAQQALARPGIDLNRKVIRRVTYRHGQRSLRLRDEKMRTSSVSRPDGPLP